MSSYIAEIGDAIVAYIKSTGLADPKRVYMPEVELENLDRVPQVYLRSSILESPRSDVPHSRTRRFIDIPYDLMLIARVGNCGVEAVDEVVALFEELDLMLYRNLRVIKTSDSYTGTALWLESSMDTLFNQDSLREQRVAQVNGQIVYRYQV